MPRPVMFACLLLSVLFTVPLAAEKDIPVDNVGVGYQRCPVVLAGPSDGFYFVVFASNTYGDHPKVPGGVFAQRLGPSGQLIGSSLALEVSPDVNCVTAEPAGPGRLLVAWGRYDYPDDTIYARYFDYEGKPLSPKVEIGESSSHLPAAAACDAEGRCWVAWIEPGATAIRARRVDAGGQLSGPPIRVDSSPGPGAGYFERYQIDLSADPRGGFVAAWWNGSTETGTPEDPPVPPSGEVHLRRFTAAGDPLGDEFLLEPGSELAYRTHSLCHTATGAFFVAASRILPDFVSPSEVVLQRFDPSGAPVGPLKVITQGYGSTLACGPASVLLLWQEENVLFGNRFSLSGELLEAPVRIAEDAGNESAALLSSGRFLVAWQDIEPDGTSILAGIRGPVVGSLALHGGRFLVQATYRDPRTGTGGTAEPRPLTDDTGLLWFFDSNNVELVVKTLDGCAVNDHFWFFAAGLTDVEVEITVTDTVTGSSKRYRNPGRTAFLPIQDTRAFDCP